MAEELHQGFKILSGTLQGAQALSISAGLPRIVGSPYQRFYTCASNTDCRLAFLSCKENNGFGPSCSVFLSVGWSKGYKQRLTEGLQNKFLQWLHWGCRQWVTYSKVSESEKWLVGKMTFSEAQQDQSDDEGDLVVQQAPSTFWLTQWQGFVGIFFSHLPCDTDVPVCSLRGITLSPLWIIAEGTVDTSVLEKPAALFCCHANLATLSWLS